MLKHEITWFFIFFTPKWPLYQSYKNPPTTLHYTSLELYAHVSVLGGEQGVTALGGAENKMKIKFNNINNKQKTKKWKAFVCVFYCLCVCVSVCVVSISRVPRITISPPCQHHTPCCVV